MKTGFWCLHRSTAHYKGGLPVGLEDRILKMFNPSQYVNLCSGSCDKGLRIDVNPEYRPTIVADATHVPLRDKIADLVFIVPPYSENYAKTLYKIKLPSITRLLDEATRITKAGGRIVLLHFYAPKKPKETMMEQLIAIHTGPQKRVRLLSVFRKLGTLLDCPDFLGVRNGLV